MLYLPKPESKTVALVPIKTFHRAKSRMSPTLTLEIRVQLAKWFAANTATTLQSIVETYALCDDDETFAELHSMGVPVIQSPRAGLNESIDFSLTWLRNNNVSYAFVVHSDLPLISISTIEELLDRTNSHVIITPDRWEAGTNLLGIPYPMKLKAMFGNNSFYKYSTASLSGHTAEVLRSQTLGLDIDTIEDLAYVLKRYPKSKFSMFCRRLFDHDTLAQMPVCNNTET